MTRIMYDSTTAGQLPAGGDLYAAYLDGRYANLEAVQARFPGVPVVTITVTGQNPADVIDVEKGNAGWPTAVEWAKEMEGQRRIPTVYCSEATWPAGRAAFLAAGLKTPLWWIAAYPGPGAVLYPGAVAHQWKNSSTPLYDQSVVADYWPGVDPVPVPPGSGGITIMGITLGSGTVPYIDAVGVNGHQYLFIFKGATEVQWFDLSAQVGAQTGGKDVPLVSA